MNKQSLLRSFFIFKNNYLEYRSFFSYLSACTEKTALRNLIDCTSKYFRRCFLISRLIRISASIISAIETSAVFLILLSIIIVIIPLILITVFSVAVICFIQYLKSRSKVEKALHYPQIYIVFASNHSSHARSNFQCGFLKELTRNGLVLLILPLFSEERFLTLKKKSDVYLIKLHYFYYIKHLLIKNAADKLTIVYF